jgi:hypothetical protein
MPTRPGHILGRSEHDVNLLLGDRRRVTAVLSPATTAPG